MKPMAPVLSALGQRFSTNPGLLIESMIHFALASWIATNPVEMKRVVLLVQEAK